MIRITPFGTLDTSSILIEKDHTVWVLLLFVIAIWRTYGFYVSIHETSESTFDVLRGDNQIKILKVELID